MSAKKWRCTVCNYIHVGDNPPDVCPECGVGPELFEAVEEMGSSIPSVNQNPSGVTVEFEDLTPEERKVIDPAVFKISYGLYIVGSIKDDKVNAQTCNTVFQITNDPLTVALGINKRNLTWEYIQASGVVSINILGQEDHELVKNFGFRSGRDADKFEGIEYTRGNTGAPIIDTFAYLEGRILPEKSIDMGTHTLFIARITAGKLNQDLEPMTYAYYRKTK